MNDVTSVLSNDPTVVAAANFFALVAGAILLVRLIIAIWRFAVSVYHSSIRAAFVRIRTRNWFQNYRCATDTNYYLAHLTYGAVSLAWAVVGLLAIILGSARPLEADSFLTPKVVEAFYQISSALFILCIWIALARMTAMAKGVARFRRRFRREKRRAALGLIADHPAKIAAAKATKRQSKRQAAAD